MFNFNLIEHGIQNEDSDYRIHVGFLSNHIYVFPTWAGTKAIQEAIEQGVKPKRATQPGAQGLTTALGFAIPIDNIELLKEIPIPSDILTPDNSRFRRMSTGGKGNAAVGVARNMLSRGLIPLEIPKIEIVEDKDIQIKGTDILLYLSLKIQVKCDYKAGRKMHHNGATGNLYLQTAECNPFKQY